MQTDGQAERLWVGRAGGPTDTFLKDRSLVKKAHLEAHEQVSVSWGLRAGGLDRDVGEITKSSGEKDKDMQIS